MNVKDIEVAIRYTFNSILDEKGVKLTIPVSSAVKLPTIHMTIGSQIKYFRSFKGLTQEELAKTVGVSRNSIMHIENDELLLVNISLLDKLVSYLGIENKINYEDEYIDFIKNNPADQIRAYRKKNNITMYELSKRLNTSCTTVKRWEYGKSIISRKCFERFKKLLTDDVL